MPRIPEGNRSVTYFDLGDFTLDHVGKGLYRLHHKKRVEDPRNREITEAEAEAALRRWGILNGLATLPLKAAERFVRQVRVGRFYEGRGNEELARAFYEQALQDAQKVGIDAQVSPLEQSPPVSADQTKDEA